LNKPLSIAPEVIARLKGLPKAERVECLSARCDLAEGFGRLHLHGGLGILKLGDGLFECRGNLALRFVFRDGPADLFASFLENHDEVKALVRSGKERFHLTPPPGGGRITLNRGPSTGSCLMFIRSRPKLITALLLLAAWSVPSAPADRASATVVATLQPQFEGFSFKGVRLLARADGDDTALDTPLGADLTSALALRTGSSWRLSCAGERIWCPTITLSTFVDGSSVGIPVFRAATLQGRVAVPRGESEPSTLLLQGRAKHGEHVLEFDETLPVDQGAFRISVPRTRLDLRLAAQGWVPHYLWDLQPVRGSLDVGALTLRRGASVSGFVVDPDTGRPLDGVEARLGIFASDVPENLTDPEWTRLTTTRGRSDKEGFFQVAGVAPGRYQLELGRTGEPATTTLTVEVVGDAETSLGEIALARPVDFHVTLSPRTDPMGRRWKAGLWRRPRGSDAFDDTIDREADAGGLVRFDRVRPAQYAFMVRDSSGSMFHREDLEIVESREAAISLPLVKVSGEVILGEMPLAATLAFTADQRDRVSLQSDSEGRFEGWLRRPRKRFLYVEVESNVPRVRRALELRNIDPEAEALEIEVRLEDGALAGIVVDEQGRPVQNARVSAQARPLETVHEAADAEGRFEIRGLPHGTIGVWAYHPDYAEPDPVEVNLSATAPSADLRLILSRGRRLRSRLVSAEGEGIPGAKVGVSFVGAVTATPWRETDLAGSYPVVVPSDAALAHVWVVAPTHMLWSGCVPVPVSNEEWVLSLPALPGGELRVRMLGPADPAEPLWTAGQLFLVNDQGGMLNEAWLRLWASLLGQREVRGVENEREYRELTVPSVAPGTYSLIRSQIPYHTMVARACTAGHAPASPWLYVGPNGQATLTYDVDAAADSSSARGRSSAVQ
jgi:hypothetical protein